MADNPEEQQEQYEQEIADDWQRMTNIVGTQIVEVRQQAVQNQPPARPWINMRQVGQQRLAIAGNNIEVVVAAEQAAANQTFVQLGNDYRARARPVVYDDGGQQRLMVETCYQTPQYRAMFSYGICGCSGPQAELVTNDNNNDGDCLLVIDQPTAEAMRNQWVNTGDRQSLIHQLIWSANFLTTVLSTVYQWSNGNFDDHNILDLRHRIYIMTDRCIDQLSSAIRSKNIYRKAIVVADNMNLLIVVNPTEPFMKPLPPVVEVPDIVVPNMTESLARINGFIQEVTASQMFTHDWQAMFARLANLQTSVPITVQLAQFDQYDVHLANNHVFQVRVETGNVVNNNQWTFRVRSPVFSDSMDNCYHVWPVDDFEPLQVRRCTNQISLVPLHSHGLAGSYDDIDQGGNNGFQVTTIDYNEVDGLDHRRLYFVNRAMAMELREWFEMVPNHPMTVMSQYHQWFIQLVTITGLVCDLRQWYRGVAYLDIDDNHWLIDIQNCAQQLFAIRDQLFPKYEIISRLEQLWHHSLLVPNIQAQEPKVKHHMTAANIYSGKKSDNKRKATEKVRSSTLKASVKGSSGGAGKQQKILKTK